MCRMRSGDETRLMLASLHHACAFCIIVTCTWAMCQSGNWIPSTCIKVLFFSCSEGYKIVREPGPNSVAGCQEWLGIKLQSGQNTLNCGCHCDCLITALCNLDMTHKLVWFPDPSGARKEWRKALVNNSWHWFNLQNGLPVYHFRFIHVSLFCTDCFSSKLYFQYFNPIVSQFPLHIIDKPITIKNSDIITVELRLRLANMSVFLSLTMTTWM